VTHPALLRESALGRQVAVVGNFTLNAARALRDRRTWGPLLLEQMRRLGVESVPIALFIALFTGIVLALLSKYIFTGAVPIYFVGTLVGKSIMLELGPVLTERWPAGRRQHRRQLGTMRVTSRWTPSRPRLRQVRLPVVPRVIAGTLMIRPALPWPWRRRRVRHR
jgi:phospholipid/cholesterol/gamma-HCH transport system permease protein